MAKKGRERVANASPTLAEKIDAGHKLDTDIKTEEMRFKALKAKISDTALSKMKEGELSLRLLGNKASALVSVSENYSLDAESDDFEKILEAADKGELDGVVKKKISVQVDPSMIDEIRRLVGQTVFDQAIAVNASYSVDAEGYRNFEPNGSLELVKLKEALDAAVVCSTTTKIRFKEINGKKK